MCQLFECKKIRKLSVFKDCYLTKLLILRIYKKLTGMKWQRCKKYIYKYNMNVMLYSHMINMDIYTYTCRIHIDAIIKTSEDFFKKIYLSLYLKGVCVRGSWRPNGTATYWPPLLRPSVLCLSRSPGLLNRRPGGPAFCWVLAFSTTSSLQLLVSKTQWLPVFTELYNSSIAHSIFGMACLIAIKRK